MLSPVVEKCFMFMIWIEGNKIRQIHHKKSYLGKKKSNKNHTDHVRLVDPHRL